MIFKIFCLLLALSEASVIYHPINPIENYDGALFQGDILLRNASFLDDRFATRNKLLRWPSGEAFYTIDEDEYSESQKELIRSAMDEFEKQTCIKWIERTEEDAYVEISSEHGCFAEVGRMGGPQSLSLDVSRCMKKGVIMHELMHALGFLHEHTRPDRDEYVQVMWHNIANGYEEGFNKWKTLQLDDLGLDYDYTSIMHYGAYFFATDRSQPTLRPVHHQVSLDQLGNGQTEGIFTPLDIQKINAFYEC